MSAEYPIIDRIKEANPLNPLYGPGSTDVCKRCVARMVYEHDIEHRIADELEKMSFPSEVGKDGRPAWATLHDLLKLRRGKHEQDN